MSRCDRTCRLVLQPAAPDNLAHLSVRKFGKHGLPDCCAIRRSAAPHSAGRAYATLRLDLLHVKNLALVENAKEHSLPKFVLQPIQIRPSAPPEVAPNDPSGSQLVEPQPQAIAPCIWV